MKILREFRYKKRLVQQVFPSGNWIAKGLTETYITDSLKSVKEYIDKEGSNE